MRASDRARSRFHHIDLNHQDAVHAVVCNRYPAGAACPIELYELLRLDSDRANGVVMEKVSVDQVQPDRGAEGLTAKLDIERGDEAVLGLLNRNGIAPSTADIDSSRSANIGLPERASD